ncbi:type II secretion system F family protein [Nocardioides sp. YIM 152588]|uniref:type II secretion system F family protein n=1 Tax=Nocardioides sp. YIM 152588 TaxID=3158259 RepID=UPI0032E4DD0B
MTGLESAPWLLYAGTAVLGLGALVVAVLLVPGRPTPMSVDERISAYAAASGAAGSHRSAPSARRPARTLAAGVLQRNRSLDARLTRLLTAAGSEMNSAEWLVAHVGVALGGGALGLLVGRGSAVVALLFVAAGAVLPSAYLRWRATQRARAFNAALPETLQLMAGALSVGMSLGQAVDVIVREGPDPIASEFKRVQVETRIGVSLEDALESVALRFESKDFAWVVMAIRIQRQVGGNLAQLLTTVADTMRERDYLRRQVHSLAAEGKYSAYILTALPVGFFTFQLVTNRSYLEPLFTDPVGIAMLVGSAFWLALGVFWMSRMIRVEV